MLFAGLVTASSVDGLAASASASLFGEENVGSGVHSGARRIFFGVPDASACGVAFITGSGSDVHDLMEHGPSDLHLVPFVDERQGAYADVSLVVLNIGTSTMGAHDIGKSVVATLIALSLGCSATHDGVVAFVSVLQELHGVFIPELNVLVVVVIAFSEPLLEALAVRAPAFVSFSDDLIHSSDRGHDPFLLGGSAVRVSLDGVLERSVIVLNLPHTFSGSFLSFRFYYRFLSQIIALS